MNKEEILKAKEELKKAVTDGKLFAEVARIIGEPLDPLRPYPKVVEMLCEVSEPADKGEDVYKFDVDEDVKEVFYINANGQVTSTQVTPATPSQINFCDVLTTEFYVAFTDLLKAKYDVLGRKKVTIGRALNADEIKKTLLVHDSAIINDADHRIVLGSGETKFKYSHLIAMREAIKDYGDGFVLVVGSQIDEDIILWDYDENKYHSLKEALADLRIEIVRVVGKVSIGDQTTSPYNQSSSEKSLLNANKAILVALNTEAGKPAVFCRRMIDSLELLGGEIDAQMQRATILSPAIMPVGTKRIPAVGVVGFESVALAVRNNKAIAGFYRGSSWVAES